MGQDVNVVYRTTRPRYVVERQSFDYNYWTKEYTPTGWEPDQGFSTLDKAKEYADEQQAIFPEAEFRIVDTQP